MRPVGILSLQGPFREGRRSMRVPEDHELRLDQRTNQISSRDDANEFTFCGHRHANDFVLDEAVHDLLERSLCVHGQCGSGHDLRAVRFSRRLPSRSARRMSASVMTPMTLPSRSATGMPLNSLVTKREAKSRREACGVAAITGVCIICLAVTGTAVGLRAGATFAAVALVAIMLSPF